MGRWLCPQVRREVEKEKVCSMQNLRYLKYATKANLPMRQRPIIRYFTRRILSDTAICQTQVDKRQKPPARLT